MPVSISDFATQINSHIGVSGSVFRTSINGDGSIQVIRASSANSGTWSVLFPRVVYNSVSDVVDIGDGSGMATGSAAAFIAGLN